MNKRVYILVGPTAVGKTEVALGIAEKLDAWIISADSRQVYRHMDIGTAKPSQADRMRVRHFLIDIIDPDSTFSAGAFLASAHDVIDEAFEKDVNILIVGGTGLYIRALVRGFDLADTPRIDEIRNELEEQLERDGLESLVEELRTLDPKAFEAIDSLNPRRVIRALEIIKATGKPLDDARGSRISEEMEFVVIGLRRERDSLGERIRLRTYSMLHAGWMDEVRELMKMNYPEESPAMSGIGYKELREFLEGKITLDLAIERIITRTRQYAKRQMTWFNADDFIRWCDLDADDEPGEISERILKLFLET